MALEAIAKLFSNREIYPLDSFDIQHGIERFLQKELCSEKIHCKVRGNAMGVDIQVGSTALAEAMYIRESDIRKYALSQLQCSLGSIRVILET